jgi:hypothetical protein
MDAEELVAAVARALAQLFDTPDDAQEQQLVHAVEQVLQVCVVVKQAAQPNSVFMADPLRYCCCACTT